MRLDLHLHTTCSDGACAAQALPALAARAGLAAIAVTDHDGTAGVVPAQSAAAPLGLLVIAGVELTCAFEGEELHLIGYGLAPAHPALSEATGRLASMRRQRIRGMIERLRALDLDISESDVRPPAGNTAPGRPHVAEALVRLGVVRHPQEAFNRFLRVGGPAYVPSAGLDVAQAIAAVHAAGGVAVWAHPSRDDAKHFGPLGEIGLDGVETMRPNVTGPLSAALEQAARAARLLVSGGSDWHGGNPPLGSWYVTDRHVSALLARLGINAQEGRPVA